MKSFLGFLGSLKKPSLIIANENARFEQCEVKFYKTLENMISWELKRNDLTYLQKLESIDENINDVISQVVDDLFRVRCDVQYDNLKEKLNQQASKSMIENEFILAIKQGLKDSGDQTVKSFFLNAIDNKSQPIRDVLPSMNIPKDKLNEIQDSISLEIL